VRRLVDIFSGCGGLSLGFDLLDEQRAFQTVLAIDNEPSATRLFNANFSKLHSADNRAVARTVDICWFESAAEVRLFYLSHLAVIDDDQRLRQDLLNLGFGSLLSCLRRMDADVDQALVKLGVSKDYRAAGLTIEPAASLAIVKKSARSLGIKSFQRPSVDERALPWAYEARTSFWQCGTADDVLEPITNSTDFSEILWAAALAPITGAAEKVGRGQHAGNAGKCERLLTFLSSPEGGQLKTIVSSWRDQRRRLITDFAAQSDAVIRGIYTSRYQVAGLLGGPPCKGFSRIGRPIANSLRQQGVFAWSNDAFGDERNKLVLHYVLFLEALRPDFFVFENVSNFQSSLKTPDGSIQADEILAEAVRNLSGGDLNYEVAADRVSACDFSVPQSRLRYIMFGVNSEQSNVKADGFFEMPRARRSIGVAEAFYGLPRPSEFSPGGMVAPNAVSECAIISPPASDPTLKQYFDWVQVKTETGTDAHIYRKMRPDDAAFFRYVGPGIRWMDWELRDSPTLDAIRAAVGSKRVSGLIEGNLALRLILEETQTRFALDDQHLLQASYQKNRSGSHGDWLERLAGDRPSKTIVAHIGKDTYGYLHPYENRPITIRESARLQSFPDWFSFASSGVVDAYTAIGNAVPPLLANMFARQVLGLLYGGSLDRENANVVDLPSRKTRRHRG